MFLLFHKSIKNAILFIHGYKEKSMSKVLSNVGLKILFFKTPTVRSAISGETSPLESDGDKPT